MKLHLAWAELLLMVLLALPLLSLVLAWLWISLPARGPRRDRPPDHGAA